MAGRKPKNMPANNDTSESYDQMLGVKAQDAPRGLTDFMDEEDQSADDLDQMQTWEKLWQGMPKYQPRNTEPVKQLMLNFDTWEDYWAFAKLIDFQLTEKTKSVYYPPRQQTVPDVFRWVDENAGEDDEDAA